MVTLKIPTPLRSYTDGQTEISVQGETVGSAMQDLVAQYPTLRPHLFNLRPGGLEAEGGQAELRPFVNLFLNNENIKDLQSLGTPLKDGDRLMLIPSIAGGREE
jgi:molybdopterin converting factor small subunit